jgi:hypothetical protein
MLVGKTERKRQLEDLGTDGRVILKSNLRKLEWSRVDSSGSG